jgi:hypothetical protein
VLQACLLSGWKQVLAEHFPEPVDPEVALLRHDGTKPANFQRSVNLFLKYTLKKKKPQDCQWIYMSPGGYCGIRKDLTTSPMDHLHQFREMLHIMETLPTGDIQTPNAALQVEWFYMSFHCAYRTKYLCSKRRLCNETLSSLAEYFKSNFEAQVSNSLLQKKREEQIRACAHQEYRHKLQT